MRPLSRTSQPLDEASVAGALLGADCPLVRALEGLDSLLRQLLAVAALATGGVVAFLAGERWALSLAIAAWALAAVIGPAVAVAAVRTRDLARDQIVAGRGQLPLAPIERVRRRLLDHRHRCRLARSLDKMRLEATRSPGPLRPLFSVRTVAALGPELTEIAERLRDADGDAGLRGVALAESLLLDGGSPLYRDDVALLRDELNRVRSLLQARPGPT
jgi:hypothetical protein